MNRMKPMIVIISMVVLALTTAGCNRQATDKIVEKGTIVTVQYRGTLADGSVFDPGDQPLTFTVGGGQVIPGFDSAVRGMKVDDSATITIPPDQAYGPVNPDLITTVKRSDLPDVKNPAVGQTVRVAFPGGGVGAGKIIAVRAEDVTVDGNNPLAGRDLTFFIRVLEIK
ncbi:MAG: peptidylprolyl isomerase [Spirochaetales bacterium]|nr:peptidylprolyl isomerase [Spirochaetales bacterium]